MPVLRNVPSEEMETESTAETHDMSWIDEGGSTDHAGAADQDECALGGRALLPNVAPHANVRPLDEGQLRYGPAADSCPIATA